VKAFDGLRAEEIGCCQNCAKLSIVAEKEELF
jgi:hypothetical protein